MYRERVIHICIEMCRPTSCRTQKSHAVCCWCNAPVDLHDYCTHLTYTPWGSGKPKQALTQIAKPS